MHVTLNQLNPQWHSWCRSPSGIPYVFSLSLCVYHINVCFLCFIFSKCSLLPSFLLSRWTLCICRVLSAVHVVSSRTKIMQTTLFGAICNVYSLLLTLCMLSKDDILSKFAKKKSKFYWFIIWMSNNLDLKWGPTFCGASSESKLFAKVNNSLKICLALKS